MTPGEFERLSTLLDEALSQPDGARDAWLAHLADRDPQSAAQVGELLESAAAASAQRLLETRHVVEHRLAQAAQLESWIGRTIGPYRVIASLGQGGMGAVWLAERADGLFSRRVALKLVHRTLDASASERFALEREILAGLEHPYIARLLDAGFTDDGQPYLALEYVEGKPLTAYCDSRNLTVRSRVELFLQVVDAVQFAHAKLVVHRDLKPANILVTSNGQVRLLDFGIAKLIAEGQADDSPLTQVAGSAFTPEYASPEQILGHTVTTSSDVYALGVVLYELLCGRRPYQLKRDSRGALEDAILGADPPRPSQVTIPEPVARARSTTVKRLRRELAGDLDTILIKTLKKRPEERYASADALGADLQRHLHGQPVVARPDTGAYHLRKFIARNKWPVAAATVTAAALIAGTGVSLWQASVARENAAAAQREATKAKAVQDFLLDIFSMNSVEQRDPEKARQTTARELLDLGAKRVDAALKDAPEARNEVLDTLANMYWQLGLPDEAAKQQRQRIDIARRLHGPDDPRVAEAMLAYADAIIESPARSSAVNVLDEAKRVLDATQDMTSERRGRLLMTYARAHTYTSFRETLRAADEAVAFFRTHHPDSWSLPRALQVAANARMSLGEYEQGEALYRAALAEVRRLEPGASAFAIVPLAGIANARSALGDVVEAERHYREALAVSLERNGPYHGETLQSQVRLGHYLHLTSRREEARRLMADATDKLRPSSGPSPPGYVIAVVSGIRGSAMIAEGSLAVAQPLVAVDVADARQNFPASQPLAGALRIQAALENALGNYTVADALLAEADQLWQRVGREADPALRNRFTIERARVALARDDPAAALALLENVVPARYAQRLPVSLERITVDSLVAQAKLRQGSYREALESAQRALRALEASSVRAFYMAYEAEALLRLGMAQHALRDLAAARASLARAVDLRATVDAPTSPSLAETQLALAACLYDLGERGAASSLEQRARTILAADPRPGAHFMRGLALKPSSH
jgi:serine/threonine protein kinase